MLAFDEDGAAVAAGTGEISVSAAPPGAAVAAGSAEFAVVPVAAFAAGASGSACSSVPAVAAAATLGLQRHAIHEGFHLEVDHAAVAAGTASTPGPAVTAGPTRATSGGADAARILM
ncbi:Uncharacterised protein [Mycobacteroides abscessus subsp. abscessus]|nr:Uncharacterised protein [Mycobacteroides abscessus subsp. abscessus]